MDTKNPPQPICPETETLIDAFLQHGRDQVRREDRRRWAWFVASIVLIGIVSALVTFHLPLPPILSGCLLALVSVFGQQFGQAYVVHAWMASAQADSERRLAAVRAKAVAS